MTLTKNQIEQIKKFIHSRGFTHIEVEMEILDHVATAVEEKLEKHPAMTLEKAIQEIHAGFGPLGFSTFEDSIHKSVNKMLKREFWQACKYYLFGQGALTTLFVFVISFAVGLVILPMSEEAFYRLFFYPLGILVTTFCVLKIKKQSKKWFKKSIVIALTGSYSAFAFTIFGQGAGLLVQDIIQYNYTAGILSFAFFTTITIGYGLAYLRLFQVSFNWTHERYLKYA